MQEGVHVSSVEYLGSLAKKMVEMMKDKILTLVLLLPIATTKVVGVFSAMKYVK